MESEQEKVITKDKFKSDIKNKINSKLDEEIVKLANGKTKMRFCKNAQRKEYIDKMGCVEAKTILKLKLNMLEVKK